MGVSNENNEEFEKRVNDPRNAIVADIFLAVIWLGVVIMLFSIFPPLCLIPIVLGIAYLCSKDGEGSDGVPMR